MTSVAEVKPCGADLFLKHRNPNDFKEESKIVLWETPDDSVNHFEVMAIGPKVRDIAVGDIVLVKWTDCTPPFDMDERGRYVISDHTKVLAVMEP